MFPDLHLQQNALYFFISLKKYWRKTNEIRICSNSKQQTANSKQQTATKLISITALLAFGLIGCTTKKKDNSKALIGLLALNSLKAAATCTTANYISSPITSSTFTDLKFSYISAYTAWLGYFSITGATSTSWWLVEGPATASISSASFTTYLTDQGCSGETSANSNAAPAMYGVQKDQVNNVPATFPIATSSISANQKYYSPTTGATILFRMFISDSTASSSVSTGWKVKKAY